MKMYLISDNVDTYTGMRLAGVDGIVVHEQDELKQALERVLEDKSIGIVLLTEKFGREFPAIIDTFRLERKMPLLVEFQWHGTGRKRFYHILYNGSDRIEIIRRRYSFRRMKNTADKAVIEQKINQANEADKS